MSSGAKEHTAIIIPPQCIWKMFSKEISKEELNKTTIVSGNRKLADKMFEVIAVMA